MLEPLGLVGGAPDVGVGGVRLLGRGPVGQVAGQQPFAHLGPAAQLGHELPVQPGLVDAQPGVGQQAVAVEPLDVVALVGRPVAPDVDLVVGHGADQQGAGDGPAERGGVEVGQPGRPDVERAAGQRDEPLLDQRGAAVDDAGDVGAVLLRPAGDARTGRARRTGRGRPCRRRARRRSRASRPRPPKCPDRRRTRYRPSAPWAATRELWTRGGSLSVRVGPHRWRLTVVHLAGRLPVSPRRRTRPAGPPDLGAGQPLPGDDQDRVVTGDGADDVGQRWPGRCAEARNCAAPGGVRSTARLPEPSWDSSSSPSSRASRAGAAWPSGAGRRPRGSRRPARRRRRRAPSSRRAPPGPGTAWPGWPRARARQQLGQFGLRADRPVADQLGDPAVPGRLGRRRVAGGQRSSCASRRRLRRHRRRKASSAFWACSRFSASSQTADCGPSITSSVISQPRCAGRQCSTIASASARPSSSRVHLVRPERRRPGPARRPPGPSRSRCR